MMIAKTVSLNLFSNGYFCTICHVANSGPMCFKLEHSFTVFTYFHNVGRVSHPPSLFVGLLTKDLAFIGWLDIVCTSMIEYRLLGKITGAK